MPDPLRCAECKVELTTADAEDAIATDAGPVHRECFDGPVPPPAQADDLLADEEVWTPEMIEEEEEARRDHGDVPLPPFFCNADNEADGRPDREALERTFQAAADAPLDLSGPKVVVHPDHVEDWERFFAGITSGATDCPECHAEPSINGGRGFLCRGRSMLP